ncbi:malto-oligosyltrehalose trehalohydrolase [Paradesertivirga mongoliensis]|uniref:Malto-oligosyltrehalose trehalohydrolase n=1 Tax=Paradesertivirga mongoliensis TaxID=2100740 RepID=A0ABW4ZJI7_9SPHI|nr:malto-oligosyltrehalose trehalohydrolase [Pedobacter mongoliensis]
MKTKISDRSLGLNFNSSGTAEVLLWAPFAKQVELLVGGKAVANLEQGEQGYWKIITGDLKPGDQYKFRLDGVKQFPDPTSLSQPEGVHGPSEAVDLAGFTWEDQDWKNIPLKEYILYELHTGTFTQEGTFEGIESKLSYLKDLGVNAIELMPLAQFPGNRNWGYDGVQPFSVQNSYGGARELQKLIDACHAKGIAVIVDVVYNHLGPEGNYLGDFGPYFTDKYHTPWGNAINFDDSGCDGVRRYFIENALMWFRDFHVDALRLDAVHAIKDFSPVHIVQELKMRVNELMEKTGRRHYLIAELDLNDNRFINPLDQHGYGMDAQWLDEFHHALRVTAGGEPTGYYSDFNGISHLAKSYKDAYVYDGQFSPHRNKTFGVKADHNPGEQFVVFSQNHDHIGNRMLGERSSQLMGFEMQKVMAAAVICSPFLPMLFMGEEWSETNPFLYFVSHTDPQLAEAVRKGRKAEFAAFQSSAEAPDPMAEDTFGRSKLQWELLNMEPHQTMFNYYRQLIALRKNHPVLKDLNRKQLSVQHNEEKKVLILRRWNDEQQVMCMMNFSESAQAVIVPAESSTWIKLFDSSSPEWKGHRFSPDEISSNEKLNLPPVSFLMYQMLRKAQTEEEWQMLGHS